MNEWMTRSTNTCIRNLKRWLKGNRWIDKQMNDPIKKWPKIPDILAGIYQEDPLKFM